MKVIVFGASGATGSLVVEQALARGHEVSVLLRDRSDLKLNVAHVFEGDATNPDDVLRAMHGQEAAIDTIGGSTPYKETHLESSAAQNIIDAMRKTGARRLIAISMMGIGDSESQAPFWYRYLLMPTFLRGSTKDKTEMESEVQASGIDFVLARPPLLTNDAATGNIRILDDDSTGHKITRADLAVFLVDQLETDEHLNRAITVVNS